MLPVCAALLRSPSETSARLPFANHPSEAVSTATPSFRAAVARRSTKVKSAPRFDRLVPPTEPHQLRLTVRDDALESRRERQLLIVSQKHNRLFVLTLPNYGGA